MNLSARRFCSPDPRTLEIPINGTSFDISQSHNMVRRGDFSQWLGRNQQNQQVTFKHIYHEFLIIKFLERLVSAQKSLKKRIKPKHVGPKRRPKEASSHYLLFFDTLQLDFGTLIDENSQPIVELISIVHHIFVSLPLQQSFFLYVFFFSLESSSSFTKISHCHDYK